MNNRVLTGSWVGHLRRRQVALRELRRSRRRSASSPSTASTSCAACCSASIRRRRPIGFNRGWAALYFPPLGLLLVAAAALRAPPAGDAACASGSLAAAVLFALVSPNMFLGVHFNRYILWAFPTLLALVAVGAGDRWPAPRGGRARPRASSRGVAALFLAARRAVHAALRRALRRDGGRDPPARRRRRALDRAHRCPAGVAMANVATSVEYLTGHRNVNLHGVTSPAFFGTRAGEREAGMLEGLARLPAIGRRT